MVAFDIDGVILRGRTLLPGAAAAIEDVRRRGLSLRFVTNNSTRHRSEVAGKLAGLGLPVTTDMILTSAAASAVWLVDRLGMGARVLVVGGRGLVRELEEVGLDPVHARDRDASAGTPAAVVVGLDVGFDYATLTTAQQVLLGDALFVATNTDATFPAEDSILPGGGAIVAAVGTASGREPMVIGKPELGLARALGAGAGVPVERIVFVGDRLETDMEMAARAGMTSVLVLTGVTERSELSRPGALQPDFIIETLEGLPTVLERLGSFEYSTGDDDGTAG
jgi:phosphoglycolate/pyridoxal phosphate phosphatase family enzyme